MSQVRRKLIEVALPLDAINRASARENYIYKGNPSSLHKWWAQRPLATCRAVLFAQLVDDPSSRPDKFPSEEAQHAERRRLFDLIERLVVWENSNDRALMGEVHDEIFACFEGKIPPILDPFAGGGTIPMEAQRMGLEAHGSDLNPVAVLLNRSLLEIAPRWNDHQPVSCPPTDSDVSYWPNATGLAEDIRHYGRWMREEAERQVGHLYPQLTLADGRDAPVIAWLWARTAACLNPGCGVAMPLLRSFIVSKKKGRVTWLKPMVRAGLVEFAIEVGIDGAPKGGTVGAKGATCVVCGTPAPLSHIREEGKAGRLSQKLLAVVAQGPSGRQYFAADALHENAGFIERPADFPETELPDRALGFRIQAYGMTKHADLFTNRQLVTLETFSRLVREARDRVLTDALAKGMPVGESLEDGGIGAKAYADSVAVFLAYAVDKMADYNCQLAVWYPAEDRPKNLFARQAVPMVWDFPELRPFTGVGGGWEASVRIVADAIPTLPADSSGRVSQQDAASRNYSGFIVSTDPPYYDNVPYADLADFFYVWLRWSLMTILPKSFATVLTPKAQELVADPFRHHSPAAAEKFFEAGFTEVFARVREQAYPGFPVTVFYAFKQAEQEHEGAASTGWQTLLEAMISTGWEVTGTWPVRTERGGRARDIGANALASSIVLVLRPRSDTAETISRRAFIGVLQAELPQALRRLQQGSVAPVDLAQAAIGPGMAVYTRYRAVLEADGAPMVVRTALALINQVLDEVLSEQEGDLNSDSRFAVTWFSEHGWNDGDSGSADQLARAKNTSLDGLERAGIFQARAGRARLLGPDDLSPNWNPELDDRVSEWEVVVRVAQALAQGGVTRAAPLLVSAGTRVDLDNAKELAYLLFALCEKKGWSQTAILFNSLGSSWADLLSTGRGGTAPMQAAITFDEGDEE